MANNIYEERINIANFSLSYLPTLKIFGTEHRGIEAIRNKEKLLMFLHIKFMNINNMMFPYTIPRSDLKPLYAFCISTKDSLETTIERPYQSTNALLNGGSFTYAIETLIEYINKNIIECIGAQDKQLTDCVRIAFPMFRYNENRLYCRYEYLSRDGNPKIQKIATLVFDKVIWEIIGKYFDLECRTVKVYGSTCTVYRILPEYSLQQLLDDKTLVSSYAYPIRDTTEFVHPRWKINVSISNDSDPKFVATENGYVTNGYVIDTDNSHIELDKYILLSDLITCDKPVSYRITVPLSVNIVYLSDVSIALDGEYVLLKDTFDQFNCFRLRVGDIYTSDEYRELSYRKLMGITAQTVYLQNGTSTERLQEIVERLRDHFPDIGDPANASTWRTLRDLLDKKDFIEEIYNLLYQIHPMQSLGPPDSKKGKIEF